MNHNFCTCLLGVQLNVTTISSCLKMTESVNNLRYFLIDTLPENKAMLINKTVWSQFVNKSVKVI